MNNHPPCSIWAEKLVLRREDLSQAECAALDAHVAVCSACRQAQTDYDFLDAALRVLPDSAVVPLRHFSDEKRDEYREVLRSQRYIRKNLSRKHIWKFVLAIAAAVMLCFFPFTHKDNVAEGMTLVSYWHQGGPVSAIAWSPNGKYIATGGWDHTVQVWDAKSGDTPMETYTGHSELVDTLAWSPDGKYIASGSWDHTVQVWNASTGQHILTHIEGNEFVNTLAWSPDGQEIASGGSDTKVQIWNARTGATRLTYDYAIGDPVDAVVWSPDGKEIAFGGRDTTVQVWDASTETLLFTYKGHSKEVDTLAWSPDGNYVASGSYDSTVKVWDAKTGTTKLTYKGHSDFVDALAWSPDSTKIASGSWDNTAQVWATGIVP